MVIGHLAATLASVNLHGADATIHVYPVIRQGAARVKRQRV